MGLLHIANTNFEWELTQKEPASLEQVIEHHSISMQLQFLPLLYAQPGDEIGVTHLPNNSHNFHLLSQPGRHERVESWGASLSVQAWAKKHNIAYDIPPWEVVRTVNSKAFSFTMSPKLPLAALLYSQKEVEQWMSSVNGAKVLKSCFGSAGRGHLFVPCEQKKLEAFLMREGLPVIGEPWVNRLIDFSTQWIIHQSGEIEFLGETECINDARGQYRENRVGEVLKEYRHFVDHHKEIAFDLLQKMFQMGYFGNVGFDAMIYENNKLHPVIEINARKTMGFVALKLQQTRFPKQTISLSYVTNSPKENLLPDSIVRADGSLVKFHKKLVVLNKSF